ncbi:hypothetical protein WJX74_007594 [Apatococcus lobatus]|uniref:Uncharacterized protein n=1 Tax=Apatococcus lobatus TaxID=904363 RepID=A0AAW1QKU0_9CHLO
MASEAQLAEGFAAAVASLNDQFALWVATQKQQKPATLWSQGALDYLRHAVMIRRDSADKAQASGQTEVLYKLLQIGKQQEAQLSMMPLQHSKVIHFIRHGEGFHNIGVPGEDPQLTEAGWQQCAALKQHVAKHADQLRIQVVVASPLFRTLETACGVFGGSKWGSAAQGTPLMQAQSAAPQLRTAHAAIATAPGPCIIAFEGCRERIAGRIGRLEALSQEILNGLRLTGVTSCQRCGLEDGTASGCKRGCTPTSLGPDLCDRRRDTHLTRAHFPGVDFSMIQHQQDTLYDTKRVESEHSVQHRGTLLLQWLLARPESSIAVVTHHGFLGWSLSSFGHECAPAVGNQMHRGFANCEMRSMVVTDAAASQISNGLGPSSQQSTAPMTAAAAAPLPVSSIQPATPVQSPSALGQQTVFRSPLLQPVVLPVSQPTQPSTSQSSSNLPPRVPTAVPITPSPQQRVSQTGTGKPPPLPSISEASPVHAPVAHISGVQLPLPAAAAPRPIAAQRRSVDQPASPSAGRTPIQQPAVSINAWLPAYQG